MAERLSALARQFRNNPSGDPARYFPFNTPWVIASYERQLSTLGDPVGRVRLRSELARQQLWDGRTAQALEPLEHAADDDLLVMVTHMPKVGVLAGHLGQLTTFPSFRTSAASLLTIEGGKGHFQWMLDPQTLEFKRP